MKTLPPDLNALIGLSGEYEGVRYRIIEVLSDGPAVVLSAEGDALSIQSDQFGHAKRRTPKTYTLALYTAPGQEPHPILCALLSEQWLAYLRPTPV